jgi:methyltransferase family protein
MQLRPGMRLLDLGSEDGSHIASIVPEGLDVYIADICQGPLDRGAARFGFTPVLVHNGDSLPFDDLFFDVVFCSSVLEHVTPYSKDDCWRVTDGRRFRREALEHQTLFAREIQRVGHHYFVQTPNRWFPIESHTWMPCVGHLPRSLQVILIRWLNRWWIKDTIPDWNLLSARDLRRMFPGTTILRERSLGFTKSVIALRGPAGE